MTVLETELKLQTEIERSPSVFFVLTEDEGSTPVLDTLYAVQLPQDIGRFRLWNDRDVISIRRRTARSSSRRLH